MSDGHRTSIIPRPRPDPARTESRPTRRPKKAAKQRTAKAPKQTRSDKRAERRIERLIAEPPKPDRKIDFTDFTTPIPRNKQLVAHRRGRLVLGLFGVGFALAIGAALFVLPVKSWLRQSDELRTRTSEVDTLNNANDELQREVDRLQTDAGIKEAARTQLDYVEAGEHRITILPATQPITALPATWPYNLVVQIVSLRSQEATAATATTAAPVPTAVPVTPGSGVVVTGASTPIPTATSVATMVSTAAPPVPSGP